MSSTATRPDTGYLLRKLHSLTGIVPVGAFLAEHFWSNSTALVGARQYNETSQTLQSNVSQYPWVKNWLYTVQRYTGLIAFAYIGWHLYTERWLTHGKSTYQDVALQMQDPWALTFMIVGVLASSFHLGVGIWNFLCKWGLAATARAQRAAGGLGAFVGVGFSVVGVLIILSFRLNWHPFAFYATNK
jgi:succinate dehydrogenase / fumarate reductase, cytochrome b subunit